MALHGNYSVFLKTPGRFLAGSTQCGDRANWDRAGAVRNPRAGWASWSAKSSIPSGYVPGSAFVVQQTAGGMATFNSITGSGGVATGNLAGGLNGVAPLTGAGDITNAALALVVSAVAALTGSGDLSADIQGKLEAAADLAGAGDLAGSLEALANILSGLTGSGDLAGTLNSLGSLSADITVSGDLLTTANVADAVWGAIAETGYSYQDMMKILAAIAAGKTTIVDNGGGSATLTFRNLGDTLDRVEADMQDSERDTITLDLG
jgi:hypothetical protein